VTALTGPGVYDWVSTPIRAPFPHGRRGWVLARRNLTTGISTSRHTGCGL
jgi:hypothetical protein